MKVIPISREKRDAQELAELIPGLEPDSLVVMYTKDKKVNVLFSTGDRIELIGLLQAAQMEVWHAE